jgi:hypothetical protein
MRRSIERLTGPRKLPYKEQRLSVGNGRFTLLRPAACNGGVRSTAAIRLRRRLRTLDLALLYTLSGTQTDPKVCFDATRLAVADGNSPNMRR